MADLLEKQRDPSQESETVVESWWLTSTDPRAVAWRYHQSQVDNDIEGLPVNPETQALRADWDRAGISDEEQIERLRAYYREKPAPRVE